MCYYVRIVAADGNAKKGHIMKAMSMKCFLCAGAAVLLAGGALQAAEWNFLEAMPKDCVPNKSVRLIPGGGLAPGQIASNVGAAAGVKVNGFVLPETFELEAEFTPYADWTNDADRVAAASPTRHNMLWDTMGVNYLPHRRNKGLQVTFVDRYGTWEPVIYAGVGDTTCCVTGPKFKVKKGEVVKFSVRCCSFGKVEWSVAGIQQTSQMSQYKSVVSDPKVKPVIGDRLVSCYLPFNGLIRRVAVRPLPAELMAVRPVGRKSFERCETGAQLRFDVVGAPKLEVGEVEVSVEQRDPATGFVCASTCVKSAIGAAVDIPVETRVRPGRYELAVVLKARQASGQEVSAKSSVAIAVGPNFADRMPVVMWGGGAHRDVRDFGFTHVLEYSGFSATNASRAAAQQLINRYDSALAEGLRAMHSIGMLYPVDGDGRNRYYRQLRGGKEATSKMEAKQPEVSNPAMLRYACRIVDAENESVGYHPAFAGVLPSSEARDHSFPSFNTEHSRYKAETGREVPPEVRGRTANFKQSQARFPDGVVPLDDPIYAYYSWFWGGGDGWPAYTGGIAAEYRKWAGRYGDGSDIQRKRPFFSFWDPSVRCPPKWGSGGDVDVLNQWVYAVPEPMNVAGPAEEVLAMAAGRPGQLPMIMTQLICYRVHLAPTNVVVSPAPAWVKRRPKASFPTIPADTLQEAVWSMLAKPVKGILFHGWGTIFETGVDTGYVYTSPESAARLKSLLHDTVAPLGPTLKDLGRDEPEVAVLESFATAALGGPASWGWLSPAITFAQRARLDPRVVYEETIMRDGFGKTKILYAPQCVFLSAPVVEKIRAFQKAGGILVADEKLLSALKADIVVPVVAYKNPPKSDHTEDVDASAKTWVNTAARKFTEGQKAEMLANAENLRKALAERCSYEPKADSSSPDIVVYSRAWRDTPYVFAINDKRTFGDYVGQWGLTMEKGLPFSGSVTLADPGRKVGAVYELSRGGEVRFSRRPDGRVEVPLDYDTNDGRLLVFLERRIASVKVEVSPARRERWWSLGKTPCVARGGELTVKMTVCDDSGRPVPARLPVEIRVYDSAGAELDGAGFACAEDGVCTLSVRTNLNDAPGGYRVSCRDRASGIVREAHVKADAAK